MPWCGIENPLGAQNCFLNSIVQVLWHLTEFKKVLFCAEGTREHVCVSPHCLLCTLRDTLREYGRASEKGDALSVEALRQCLHVISEGQFAIDETADAAEAFTFILEQLHALSPAVAVTDSLGDYKDEASDSHFTHALRPDAAAALASSDTEIRPTSVTGEEAVGKPDSVAQQKEGPDGKEASSKPCKVENEIGEGGGAQDDHSGQVAGAGVLDAGKPDPPDKKEGPEEPDYGDPGGISASTMDRRKESPCSPSCAAHQLFYTEFVDQTECAHCRQVADIGDGDVMGYLNFGLTVWVADVLAARRAASPSIESVLLSAIRSSRDTSNKSTDAVASGHHVSIAMIEPWVCRGSSYDPCGTTNSYKASMCRKCYRGRRPFDWICPKCSTKTRACRYCTKCFMTWTSAVRLAEKQAGVSSAPIASESKWKCGTRRCRSRPVLYRHLLNSPAVFTVFLAFGTHPTKDDVASLFRRLPARNGLDLNKLFPPQEDDSAGVAPKPKPRPVSFAGMVCYSSVHYISIFKYPDLGYVQFDDTSVSVLSSWAHVEEKCIAGKYLPVMLFYTAADIAALDLDTEKAVLDNAPKWIAHKFNRKIDVPVPPPSKRQIFRVEDLEEEKGTGADPGAAKREEGPVADGIRPGGEASRDLVGSGAAEPTLADEEMARRLQEEYDAEESGIRERAGLGPSPALGSAGSYAAAARTGYRPSGVSLDRPGLSGSRDSTRAHSGAGTLSRGGREDRLSSASDRTAPTTSSAYGSHYRSNSSGSALVRTTATASRDPVPARHGGTAALSGRFCSICYHSKYETVKGEKLCQCSTRSRSAISEIGKGSDKMTLSSANTGSRICRDCLLPKYAAYTGEILCKCSTLSSANTGSRICRDCLLPKHAAYTGEIVCKCSTPSGDRSGARRRAPPARR